MRVLVHEKFWQREKRKGKAPTRDLDFFLETKGVGSKWEERTS